MTQATVPSPDSPAPAAAPAPLPPVDEATVPHTTDREVDVAACKLTPDEMYLLTRIDGELSVDELLCLGCAPSLERLKRGLLRLWDAGLVELA